jgi:hypothetical protein
VPLGSPVVGKDATTGGLHSLALAAVPLSFCATSTRIHSRRPGHL